MDFIIADTFTTSLARLTGEEQKSVKTTAFDLQMNPANPGNRLHKIERARDKNFWSIRVNADIRLIIHKTDKSLLLAYVDHHDKAYQWAERRKLETHPKTGAAQIVEIRERVQEVFIPIFVEAASPAPEQKLLFADVPESRLLGYGIPPEWIDDLKRADQERLLKLIDHLPAEASEALMELATGGSPAIPSAPGLKSLPIEIPADVIQTDPFAHPDALRRFRVMKNVDELKQALDFPWDKWTIFLHPDQRRLVEGSYSGPFRVSGSAGTGKTVVALHRAVFLARSNPEARILLTTFSDTLANALKIKLRRLISSEPRLGERIEVHSIKAIGRRLFETHFGKPQFVTKDALRKMLSGAAAEVEGYKFTQKFLLSEWEEIVDAWQLDSWEAYRDIRRLGRKTRLPEQQRLQLWSVFEKVKSEVEKRGQMTYSGLFSKLADKMEKMKNPPFDFSVIDESQDVSVAQLRFLAALGAKKVNGLFFAGDLGQRIFQQPFSWKALGIDIRGRSRSLNINYRTSHQIRTSADKLLAGEISDVDGNTEKRSNTISVFNGPLPEIKVLKNQKEEISTVSKWLLRIKKDGLLPHEIGIFVRSSEEIDRARKAVESAGLPCKILDDKVETTSGHVSICTMHLAKGLEFRAVAVMACDDEIIPLQERIETVTDESDLEEIYNTERHLLYVAITRARDQLLITSASPASEFLEDLQK